MNGFAARAATFGIMALAIAGSVGSASAADFTNGSAADTVTALRNMGYAVQINGSANQPLSQCHVTGVHGVANTDALGNRIAPNQFSTAFVDVVCPGDS